MGIEEHIKNWMGELEDSSVFLVAVDWKPGSNKLHVMVDSDTGLTVEQCRKANKLISAKLDETDFGNDAYTLEVSSPGADKPLLLPRQYAKHIRRELLVKLHTQSEITGRLEAADADHIVLQLPDAKKRYTDQSTRKSIPFSEILEAKVMLSFK